ncbi:MAG: (4Fe-4S)-binding protein [Flavobacteriales bacterium]|nr:(4Fe-4S)-binding protein [Flavobacteriales bacterium]
MESKRYPSEGFNVVWTPSKCIHSAICLKGLPGVFRKNERPWINTDAASSEEIIEQVKNCPSQALSIEWFDERLIVAQSSSSLEVSLIEQGPYIIKQSVDILMPDGSRKNMPEGCALCSCGESNNKPFCDGSHRQKPKSLDVE